MFDFDGALVVKPESARLAVLIDISCNSSLNVGLTYSPDYFWCGGFGGEGVEDEDSLCRAVGVKRLSGELKLSL